MNFSSSVRLASSFSFSSFSFFSLATVSRSFAASSSAVSLKRSFISGSVAKSYPRSAANAPVAIPLVAGLLSLDRVSAPFFSFRNLFAVLNAFIPAPAHPATGIAMA